jgi:cAMP-dependent protein kinase regulator
MVSWGSGQSVDTLIAQGKYDKAIQSIEEQLKKDVKNVRLRLQLADVLVAANRGPKAVPILLELVDQLASDGFVPKAIAVLKKVQRVDPSRSGIVEKLADLCKDEDGQALARRSGIFSAVKPASAPAASPSAVASIETVPDFDLEVAPIPPDESPLFSDFNRDELIEVIRGLELLSYEPGDVILTEGEPGESLLVLSSGSVKAFVRNAEGKNVLVRRMKEGEFFGEISLLSGKPRSATITAVTACDLLELDRASLDDITARYPGVRKVIQDFYQRRSGSESEVQARASGAS